MSKIYRIYFSKTIEVNTDSVVCAEIHYNAFSLKCFSIIGTRTCPYRHPEPAILHKPTMSTLLSA